MQAGEAGADYVMFGEPRPDGYVPPLDDVVERARLVGRDLRDALRGLRAALDDVAALAATGAEFVALGDAVWTHPAARPRRCGRGRRSRARRRSRPRETRRARASRLCSRVRPAAAPRAKPAPPAPAADRRCLPNADRRPVAATAGRQASISPTAPISAASTSTAFREATAASSAIAATRPP